MATASRNPSNSLDERLFPPIQMLERPVAERPQHDTLEGIMDWLAGPAQQGHQEALKPEASVAIDPKRSSALENRDCVHRSTA